MNDVLAVQVVEHAQKLLHYAHYHFLRFIFIFKLAKGLADVAALTIFHYYIVLIVVEEKVVESDDARVP